MEKDQYLVFEYEKYYMDCLCKSKKLLFSRSEEIAMHRMFFGMIRKELEQDERLARLIANRMDVLDDLCRFGEDHYQEEMEKLCGRILTDWKKQMMDQAGRIKNQ